MSDVHRLDRQADAAFLRSGAADPLTRVAFRPTNRVVQCATCGTVSLRETWEAVGGCPNGHATAAPWNPRAALAAAGDGARGATPRPVVPPPQPEHRRAWVPIVAVLAVAAVAIAALFLAGVFSQDDVPEEVVVEVPAERTAPEAVAAEAGEVEGRLDVNDFRSTDGRYQDLYTFAADSSGRVLSFSVASSDFYPDLVIETPDGERVEAEGVAAVADADGVLSDERVVRVTDLRGAGLYRVLVSTREPDGTGDYLLRIRQEDPVRDLAANAPAFAAELGRFSQKVDGFYRDSYRFRGTADREHVLTVRSSVFAPTVAVTGPDGRVEGEMGRAGGSVTFRFTPSRAGTHTVVVSARERDRTGAYTIALAVEAAPPPQRDDDDSDNNNSALSALRANSAPLRDSLGSGQTRAYAVSGRTGDRVTIEMRTDGFTPTLTLIGPGGQRTPATPDGDRARLRATLPSGGRYRVEIGSPSGGGFYTLSLEQQGAVTSDQIPRLPGQEVQRPIQSDVQDNPAPGTGGSRPQPIRDGQAPGERRP